MVYLLMVISGMVNDSFTHMRGAWFSRLHIPGVVRAPGTMTKPQIEVSETSVHRGVVRTRTKLKAGPREGYVADKRWGTHHEIKQPDILEARNGLLAMIRNIGCSGMGGEGKTKEMVEDGQL